MRYDDPDLQDRLAAQYALGALTGPTRRRLEALMRDRPELRARVAAWQEELAPLALHRLDAMAIVAVEPGGSPGPVRVAHLLPAP